MTTDFMGRPVPTLSQQVIDELRQRRDWLRDELTRLAFLREHEDAYCDELSHLKVLIETHRAEAFYAGLDALAESVEADPVEVEGTLEAHEVAEEVAEAAPLETAAPLAGPALVSRDRVEGTFPAEASPEALPCADSSRDPGTLAWCVDAILRTQGPASVPYLHRALLATGSRVAPSTLRDHLVRGMRAGHYAKTRQIWRLAQLEEARP